MIPFSAEVFFNFLSQYNAAIWPTQIPASIMAFVAIFLALRPTQHSGRIIAAILMVFWIWTGVVYHLSFFALINFWDLGFGVLFVIQGLFLLWNGAVRNRMNPVQTSSRAAILAGKISLAVALVLHPLLSAAFGQSLMEIAWVGTSPVPTIVLTLGLLCLCGAGRLWGLMIIPLFCCLTGSLFAYLLPLPQDLILLPLAFGVLAALLVKRKA